MLVKLRGGTAEMRIEVGDTSGERLVDSLN